MFGIGNRKRGGDSSPVVLRTGDRASEEHHDGDDYEGGEQASGDVTFFRKEVHIEGENGNGYPQPNLHRQEEQLMIETPIPRAVDKRPASFRVLDLHAIVAFKTSGSISYNLDKEPGGGEIRRVGWLDIHHPCEGPVRSQVRVVITQEYFESHAMNTIVRTALNAIEVPADAHFEAEFVFQPAAVV